MKLLALILVILLILAIIFTGCSANNLTIAKEKNVGVIKEQTVEETAENKSTDNSQKVSSQSYDIDIPRNWICGTPIGDSSTFSINDKVIGGVEAISYYPDQPLSSLLPNHSEVLKQEELKDFSEKVIMFKLRLTPPAASKETWVRDEIHYYFISGKRAFDLYFDASQVSEPDTLPIAKSFKLKVHSEADNRGSQATKTDSGRYQGQADNNFIEVKISGVPDEKAAKVFMLSEEIKAEFNALKLQKDDQIKFDYFENNNEQLVIVKLSRI